VNNAIERAIAAQDAFLDELESRRWSISSTASTFTELSRSSEELEHAVNVKDASQAQTSTSSVSDKAVGTLWNVSEGTTGTAHEIPIPALGPSLEVVAGEYHPSEATPHSPKKEAKKAKRRQKKKSSAGGAEVGQDVGHGHQLKRMKKFMASKSQEKSKKTRMCGKLCRQALFRTVTVPYELGWLKTACGVQHETRIYRHEELKDLGIRTVSWDGQLVCSRSCLDVADVLMISVRLCR